ncbi:cyanophycin synthetase [Latilactobacillus sakei]
MSWPGRFEKVNDEPLIILDGAHNPAGVEQLVKTAKHQFKHQDIYILFGALGDKSLVGMLPQLNQLATHLVLTTVPDNPRAATQAQYAAVDNTIPFEADWPVALTTMVSELSADDVLLVTGSLYLISTIRSYFKGVS